MIGRVLHSERPSGRPSPFAAAFLSLIFPGLGQAYAGLYLRALAFAAPPFLGTALLAGLLVSSSTRKTLEASIFDPTVLNGLLLLDILLFLYRLVAIVDAYRCAAIEVPEGGRLGRPRIPVVPVSLAGLTAVVLVMGMAHVALARYDRIAYDTIIAVTSGPGDAGTTTPLPAASGSTPLPSVAGTAPPQSTPAPWNGKDRLNILMVGVDQRPQDATFNTDTMIVVSIDPSSGEVAMFSIPRDFEQIPLPPEWPAASFYGGSYPNKVNSIWRDALQNPNLYPGTNANRGATALKGAIGYMMGISIGYYVEVNFSGFKKVVDTLGGVTIDVQLPVSDYHYPTDDGRGAIKLYIPPGIQHMNGTEALAYARSRHATSDFDRAQRQQRVITSIRQQTDVLSFLDPNKLDAVASAVRTSIHTDYPNNQLPQLISLIESVDLSNLRSFVFTPPQYGQECAPAECQVHYYIHPKLAQIRQAVAEAFTLDPAFIKSRAKIQSEGAQVTVLNGSGVQGQASTTADYLDYLGFDAAVGTTNGGRADKLTYPATVVTFYNGAEAKMPESVKVLQSTFGVTIVTANDPTVKVDVIVITGKQTPKLAVPTPPGG